MSYLRSEFLKLKAIELYMEKQRRWPQVNLKIKLKECHRKKSSHLYAQARQATRKEPALLCQMTFLRHTQGSERIELYQDHLNMIYLHPLDFLCRRRRLLR